MALGVSAVPAISRAFEQGSGERLSALVNSIYKYTSLLSLLGGALLYLCSEEILTLFYGKNSYDIVVSSVALVKYFALTVVLYSLAGTSVFAVQAVGCAKKSILPYAVSGVIRVILNFVLVSDEHLVLYGAVISGAVGYAVITVWNTIVLCKKAKIKFDFLRSIIFPACLFLLVVYLCNLIFSQISFPFSIIGMIIIKCSISVVLFCILCFLCGMLNFREFFCDQISKKVQVKP